MRVPRFRHTRLYFAAVFVCLLGVALTTSFAHAQGFTGGITSGKTKKKVVLRRKLPSAIKLTATSFEVKTTAHEQAGQTYYYVVTAVDGSGNESVYSNQAQAVVPTP